MNRRRIVYPALALIAAATVLIGDRMKSKEPPARKPAPFVPPVLPGESPPSIGPARKSPPIGRPVDPPLDPNSPAMSGSLQVEPVPTPPREVPPPGR